MLTALKASANALVAGPYIETVAPLRSLIHQEPQER